MSSNLVSKRWSRLIVLYAGLGIAGTAVAFTDYLAEEKNFSFGDGTTRAVALHDLDGDGNLDLIAANAGINQLWYGQGNGDFGSPLDLNGTGTSSTTVAVSVADFTGDGKADVMFINADATDHLYANDGNGNLVWNGQAPELADSECQAGQFNSSEAALDLVCANDHDSQNPGTRLWLNNGDGTFTAAGNDATTEGPANTVATADFDGDGNLDVIVGMGPSADYDGENVIWLGDGNGSLTKSTDQTTRLIIEGSQSELYPDTVAFTVKEAADDGTVNGIVEIANASGENYTGALKPWKRNEFSGDFYLTNYSGTFQGNAFRDVVAVDLDNDGVAEVITADEKNLSIHHDSGYTGLWISPKAIAVGDLDNDGDIDVVVATEDSDSIGMGEPEIAVYLNTTIANTDDGNTGDDSGDSTSDESTDSGSSGGGGSINPLWAFAVFAFIVIARRRHRFL